MGARLHQHIRTNVVGYVALFVALSGTAYAVNGPLKGTNTVGSADIINGEVGTKDVADDTGSRALTAADLAPGSVGTSEVDGSLTGADIANSFSGSDDVNADLLDGLHASSFTQGGAFASSGNRDVAVGITEANCIAACYVHLELQCGAGVTNVRLRNQTGAPLAVLRDNGGGDADYFELVNGAATSNTLNGNVDTVGDLLTFAFGPVAGSADNSTTHGVYTVSAVKLTAPTPDRCLFFFAGVSDRA